MIHMNKPFVPHQQDKLVKVEITAKESHLIRYLRTISFGKAIVHKADGILTRVETTESVLLNEDDGLIIEQ